MKLYSVKKLDSNPELNTDIYVALSQINVLGREEMFFLIEHWEKWLPLLHAYQLGNPRGYICIYLDDAVENEIDLLWKKSPSAGFKLETIAQTMIMSTLKQFLPSIDLKGCAPAPEKNQQLIDTLKTLNLTYFPTGGINKKYSTLTYFPLQNSCDVCYLKTSCPKKLNLASMFKSGK